MQRWCAVLQYEGGSYQGWQTQTHGQTVQQNVERILSNIADHPLKVQCCGRTDAGVHALGQVIHFDSAAERSPFNWLRGFAGNSDGSISLSWVGQVADDFHARYSCERRTYCYLIDNARLTSAPFGPLSTHWRYPLDINAMREAAEHFSGERDYSAVRAAGCQASSPVRHIYDLQLLQRDNWIVLRITANGFLQHMVRNIAGLLLEIGGGRNSPDWALDVLNSLDRQKAPETAPAQGLYLENCTYPDNYGIPTPRSLEYYWGRFEG